MSLRMDYVNDQEEVEITEELIGKLQELLEEAGKEEGIISCELVLSFVDDAEIRRLNKEYREIDAVTDVLSFAMNETSGEEMEIFYDEQDEEALTLDEYLGDIVIAANRAREQSEEFGHSLEREIGFLFVHGFLHLIGYDHKDEEEEKKMFAKQEKILQEAGLTR